MKQVIIDLAGPFEEIVANLSSIPATDNLNGSKDAVASELSPEVQEVTRRIYEAARGRQFATVIGLVPAGPLPIAPFLKDAPFQVQSQADFLLQALARLYVGDCSRTKSPAREVDREIRSPRTAFRRNKSFRCHQQRLSQSDKTKTMTNLPIHITTHHLSLSDSLRRFARKKITPVTRFASDALAAEIVLRRHNGAETRFSASARLALPGRDVHGRGVDGNLYVAIGKLVATLGRRLRKRKTRLAKRFQRAKPIGTLAKRPDPPAPPKLLPTPAEESAQDPTARRRTGKPAPAANHPDRNEILIEA